MSMKKGLKISSFFALKTVMNYVKKCCQNGTLKQLQDLSKLLIVQKVPLNVDKNMKMGT
jgi:hypothetical protein